jgi:glycogen phosphorylase
VTQQGPVAGSLEALGADPSCLCDPAVLTLGFARRFATYKRANLLLHDPDRLERMLCGPNSKVQLILAGKAHPADTEGKAMIRQWTEFIGRCMVRPHIMFLVDYDMDIAQHLVHGVDVWINTPRRPWEACGTSGMKVLVNGGLNLSELDGWWAEAYDPAVGWALGDLMEHDSDPAWDAVEADRLYSLLENEIIPEFYDRDDLGIPRRWMARVRESMARLVPEFSSNRMMADYLDGYYLPGAASYRERVAPSGVKTTRASRPDDVATSIEAWRALLDEHWSDISFMDVAVSTSEGRDGSVHEFKVELQLGQIPPSAVLVEVYADPLPGVPPERHVLMTDVAGLKKRPGSPPSYPFRAVIPAVRPVQDYTARVVPWHPSARVPLECSHILWFR